MLAMRYLFLALVLTGTTAPLTMTPLRAEGHVHDLACEICQMKDALGEPCKGKVTRGESSASGVSYTCSNGHKFVVKSKVRVK